MKRILGKIKYRDPCSKGPGHALIWLWVRCLDVVVQEELVRMGAEPERGETL